MYALLTVTYPEPDDELVKFILPATRQSLVKTSSISFPPLEPTHVPIRDGIDLIVNLNSLLLISFDVTVITPLVTPSGTSN